MLGLSATPLAGSRAVSSGPMGGSTVSRTVAARLRMLGATTSTGPGAGERALTLDVAGPDGAVRVVVPDAAVAENLVQAGCGIMAVHGRAEAEPRALGVDHVGVLTGVAATQAALALLLAKARGGEHGRAELSVEQVALVAVGQYVAGATAEEDPELGCPPAQGRPPFVSADGAAFEIEAFGAGSWLEFWTGLGAEPRSVGRAWRPFLLRYENATLALPRELHEAACTRTYAEVLAIGVRTGVSVCRVRSAAQRRADPGYGRGPWDLRFDDPTFRTVPPVPAAGGALPLSGVHVVESTARVQGPMASRLLAMLGATVTRIEPPGGDPLSAMPPLAGDTSAKFRVLNEGKRRVEIDFKSRSGRAEVLDLVAGADVFLHNWAPGRAAALGLDVPDLRAASPVVVCASATGWGDALGECPPAGTDYTVQAHSGIAALVSGDGRPDRPSLMIMLDVLGGFVAAEGVLAALVARERGAGGVEVVTSLLAAADPLLVPRAPTAVDGVFGTADGHIAVVTPAADALARALGLGAAADGRKAVAKALATRPTAAWLPALHAAGVAATPVCDDLSTVPARYPDSFDHHGCALVRSPWTFR